MHVYSTYGVAFDRNVNFATNIINFCVDNSSSSDTDSHKNSFLVLGEGSADDINGSAGAVQKNFGINFSIFGS